LRSNDTDRFTNIDEMIRREVVAVALGADPFFRFTGE